MNELERIQDLAGIKQLNELATTAPPAPVNPEGAAAEANEADGEAIVLSALDRYSKISGVKIAVKVLNKLFSRLNDLQDAKLALALIKQLQDEVQKGSAQKTQFRKGAVTGKY